MGLRLDNGRKSRQNDRRAMRYGSPNLPLAHARGSATLGFRLPEPRPLMLGSVHGPTARQRPQVSAKRPTSMRYGSSQNTVTLEDGHGMPCPYNLNTGHVTVTRETQ